MKTPVPGYIVQTYKYLPTTTTNNARIVADRKMWYVYQNNTWQSYPTLYDTSKNTSISNITINTNTYTLDLLLHNKFIEITLENNTLLSIINTTIGSEYILKINLNGYKITNIEQYITNQNYTFFLTEYNTLFVQILYLNKILGSTLINKQATVLQTYKQLTSPVLNLPLINSLTDISSINNSAILQNTISFVDNGLKLSTDSQITYSNTLFDLDSTDFELNVYLRFLTNSDYGSIIHRYTNNSSDAAFWLHVDSSQNLYFIFHESSSNSITLTTALNTSIKDYQITITRSHKTYCLRVNGLLVDHSYSEFTQNFCSVPFTIGRVVGLVNVDNINFTGLINDIRLYRTTLNNYNHQHVSQSIPNQSNTELLYRFNYDTLELANNYSFTTISDTSTHPLLNTVDSRISKYLDKYHHFEVPGTLFTLENNTDFTIEAWIKNHAGNTRGTLIYYGNNYHFGIYDNKLQLDSNGVPILTASVDLPTNVWTHIAVTRQGTTFGLYQNGERIGQTVSTVDLNNTGALPTLAIKREYNQAVTIANINTSLYPSKSHISIDSLRFDKGYARYTNTNYRIPYVF